MFLTTYQEAIAKITAIEPTIRQNAAMNSWRLFFVLFSISIFGPAFAQNEAAIEIAEGFLRTQTQGLPGKASIRLGPANTSRLAPCSTYEAFFPPGTRIAKKTYVGVRCLSPNTWSILIPAQIAVSGNYVATARPLIVGQTIQPGDLTTQSGDIFSLPTGTVSNINDAMGKILKNSIGAGQALRENQIQAAFSIKQGQTVKVTSKGPGFSVSAEGKAMNNAAPGQVVQVRMESGQVISAIARADGTIEISN